MTLKEYIKTGIKEWLRNETYIKMYNTKNMPFYGAYCDDPTLKEYLSMEVEKVEDYNKVIKHVWIKGYEHSLGLGSMREKEAKRQAVLVTKKK